MITVYFMDGSEAGYISGNNFYATSSRQVGYVSGRQLYYTASGASTVQTGAAGLLPIQVKNTQSRNCSNGTRHSRSRKSGTNYKI